MGEELGRRSHDDGDHRRRPRQVREVRKYMWQKHDMYMHTLVCNQVPQGCVCWNQAPSGGSISTIMFVFASAVSCNVLWGISTCGRANETDLAHPSPANPRPTASVPLAMGRGALTGVPHVAAHSNSARIEIELVCNPTVHVLNGLTFGVPLQGTGRTRWRRRVRTRPGSRA